MNKDHYVLILAGGIGSRLWPQSRQAYPKQFLDILHVGKTMLQSTYERFAKFIDKNNIYVITARDYVDIVNEQLPELIKTNLISEPSRKNTAPCVAYISFKILKTNPNANIIISPSDQVILDAQGFEAASIQALDFSDKNDAFVALGIKPLYPNTKYGYIQREQYELEKNIFKVKTFTEKPPLEMAQTFIASGDFLWNTGLFVWKAEAILKDLEKYQPEMYEAFAEIAHDINTENEEKAIEIAYNQCTNLSLDLAVMEKSENVYIIPCEFGWSDIGTWNSTYDNMEKDYLGSAINGEKIINVDASKCVVNAPKDKLVIVQGLDNYVVVDTDDVLLICKKESEGDIKDYIAEVRKKYGEKYL
ncbi:mannose-1-phosphate guanylyltransferase [Rhizosphaericola mali]|uniref:mannose-1-phosphate guanylyltransferase n=1 Tax=Rhizosphaericola mali TaxID=2545455 RepID=A0A5P2GEI3_9BACT|nr:sugar phosphate nucleotidyltransferase [Rhizosphaericola mali]QES90021.1 mannose-1-phosphate guanylyltransferase [Rhizosphaericola mali]